MVATRVQWEKMYGVYGVKIVKVMGYEVTEDSEKGDWKIRGQQTWRTPEMCGHNGPREMGQAGPGCAVGLENPKAV